MEKRTLTTTPVENYQRRKMETLILIFGFLLSCSKIVSNQKDPLRLSSFVYCTVTLIIFFLISKIEEKLENGKRNISCNDSPILKSCRPFADLGVSIAPLFPLTLLFGMFRNFEHISPAYHVTCLMSPSFLVSTLLFLWNNSSSNGNYLLSGIFSFICGLLTLTCYTEIAFLGCFVISSISTCFYFALLRGLFSRRKESLASFSLGEAITVAQLIVALFLISTIKLMTILNLFPCSELLEQSPVNIFLTLLSISCLFLFVLFTFLLEKEFHFGFYAILLSVFSFFSYPVCYWLIDREPLSWFLAFILATGSRVNLMIFWILCTILSVSVVWICQICQLNVDTILRKSFHLLILIIFLPGFFFEKELLLLATSCAFAGFLLLESARVLKIAPIQLLLDSNFEIFLDEKDSGVFVLTHLYLLLGSSLPFWMTMINNPVNLDSKHLHISLFSGILSLGFGDTIASAAGTIFGKRKWPGTVKTVEGTLFAIFAQFTITLILLQFHELFWMNSFWNIFHVLLSTIFCCLLEGFTRQVDNLTLPIFLFSMLIVL